MKPSIEWINPAAWACFALAAAAFLAGARERGRNMRRTGGALLQIGTIALLVTLAVPSLLPARSAVLHPDGSSDDPRALSALLAALAALAATAPAWRARKLSVMPSIAVAFPGVALAGLLGSVIYFAGLRAPMGLAAVAAGGMAIGVSFALALRSALPGSSRGGLLQALGAGAFALAAALSLNGMRATGITVSEDSPADTLGIHVSLAGVESRGPDHRVLTVDVHAGRDSLRLRPSFTRAAGSDWRSVADARLFSGPLVLPLRMREQRPQAHSIQWLAQGDSLRTGDATLRFTGFRVEQTDSIRMFADLVVETTAGTEKVSPGVIATPAGQIPITAEARGVGPIAVVRLDPDQHRVGLMLPGLPGAPFRHAALLDVRLRPALVYAWAAAALVLVALLAALKEREAAGSPGGLR